MITHLLDNYECNLSSYIDAQSKFIGDGIYFRIEYKRKIRNFNLSICSALFYKNFITVSDIDYSNLIQSTYSFNKKDLGYKNNPLVIDASSKVQFYLLDKLENPTINELLLEEVPGQGSLVRNHYSAYSSNTSSYLGKPEIVEKLNTQGYFYIYVTNLKQPDLPGDFTFVMDQVADLPYTALTRIQRDIEKAEKFPNHPRAKKLSLELAKLRRLQQSPYFGFKEVIEYREFLQRLSMSVADFALQKFKIPLNLKNILKGSKTVAQEVAKLLPDGRMRFYYMVTTGNNCSLSKMKNTKVKKSL